ncbi:MAG: hypothetical protein JNL96_22785 [Planctomycetaceae bacterium]|nr:hypothetical protein [Planctomycetaceae bacterium]
MPLHEPTQPMAATRIDARTRTVAGLSAVPAQVSDRRLLWFLAIQFLCQVMLMAEPVGSLRLYFRMLAYLSALAMFVVLPPTQHLANPARTASLGLLIAMSLGIVHSDTSLLAGVAHWLFVFSIWSPIFWVGRLKLTPRTLWDVIMLLWAFNVLGAVIGVLQVYYPEVFAPSAEFVKRHYGDMVEAYLIQLADGRDVWRPFGLSDSPGGAANSGSIAVIIGVAIITTPGKQLVKALALLGIITGAFCIYLCEFRSVMIATLISAIALVGLQMFRGSTSRLAAMTLIVPLLIGGAFAWTHMIGGERVQKRIKTLGEGSASTVYYQNRGKFIEFSLFNELPEYPLGAGLGRYGMMFNYFGDKRSAEARPLWAEVQLSAWIYDAGILGIVLGYAAMAAAFLTSLRLALSKKVGPLLAECAAIVLALNAGWLAVTFAYPLFMGQGGLLFWLVNSALFYAATNSRRRRSENPPAAGSASQLHRSTSPVAVQQRLRP